MPPKAATNACAAGGSAGAAASVARRAPAGWRASSARPAGFAGLGRAAPVPDGPVRRRVSGRPLALFSLAWDVQGGKLMTAAGRATGPPARPAQQRPPSQRGSEMACKNTFPLFYSVGLARPAGPLRRPCSPHGARQLPYFRTRWHRGQGPQVQQQAVGSHAFALDFLNRGRASGGSPPGRRASTGRVVCKA